MSTLLQLRTAIKQEARIKTGNNLDTMINTIIGEVLNDHCNLQRYYELRKLRVPITAVVSTGIYNLPTDYANLDRVYWARGPITPPTVVGVWRELTGQPEGVKQTYNGGIPKYWRLAGRNPVSLNLWPYNNILATDSIEIDYYILPSTIFAADGDSFPIPKLESVVKLAAIGRVKQFYNNLPNTQLTDKESDSSFVAAQGGTK